MLEASNCDRKPVRPLDGTARERLRTAVRDCGWTLCGFAPARIPAQAQANLHTWLARDYHGDMAWLAETAAWRAEPHTRFPWAQTAVCVGLAYDRPESREEGVLPNVSRYAHGRDYHNVAKKRVRRVRQLLYQAGAREVWASVDAGAVMERQLAHAAGLGWLGKHTLLLHPEWGSMLFLGVLLTDLLVAADTPMPDHCGSCDQCLRACPTDAFVEPGVLDARRCISYVNIEHRGDWASAGAETLRGWLHGCDDCQEACPFVQAARRRQRWGDAAFVPYDRWRDVPLAQLRRLDESAWDRLTLGSPLRRGGPQRLTRVAQRLAEENDVPAECGQGETE